MPKNVIPKTNVIRNYRKTQDCINKTKKVHVRVVNRLVSSMKMSDNSSSVGGLPSYICILLSNGYLIVGVDIKFAFLFKQLKRSDADCGLDDTTD